jgi:hypothetical protein
MPQLKVSKGSLLFPAKLKTLAKNTGLTWQTQNMAWKS